MANSLFRTAHTRGWGDGTSFPNFDFRWASNDLMSELNRFGLGSKELTRQLRLHLPRLSPTELTQSNIIRETERLAARLLISTARTSKDFKPQHLTHTELCHTRLRLVEPSIAETIHETFHYLGSRRGGGIHLGLYADRVSGYGSSLLSVVTLSPFDLSHWKNALPHGIGQEQVLVLSRLYAFDWCPQNTVSFSLGRVFSWIRENLPHVKMLLTYLNKNLGFQGTVYKATNWVLFGKEKKIRYLYLDYDYITDRQMIREHGTADFEKLQLKLGRRITRSIHPLSPLELYAYFFDSRHRKTTLFGGEATPPPELVGGSNI
jgi:hypothetical protein